MAYDTLIVEIEDYVSLIRLNRPDAMNALNSTLMRELAAAVTAAEANDKVRCVVITGSEKAFAAGADVKEMAEKSFIDVYFEDLFGPEAQIIARTRKPIIAAVAGYCLGGGCELAMLCDFIIAADSAKFGQPEINLGIVAGMGGTQRLTRAVGKSKSMDMHLTGRFMDAAEAERCGLVSRVVPAKSLIEEAIKAAQKIVEKSAVTAMVVKECVNRAQETSLAEGLIAARAERAPLPASSVACSRQPLRRKTRRKAWLPSWRSASRSSATDDVATARAFQSGIFPVKASVTCAWARLGKNQIHPDGMGPSGLSCDRIETERPQGSHPWPIPPSPRNAPARPTRAMPSTRRAARASALSCARSKRRLPRATPMPPRPR